MTEVEISELVKSVAAQRSQKWVYNQIGLLMPWLNSPKAEEMPCYYPTYSLAVDLMESCRYHAEKGCFPEKLFVSKSPYQTDEELTYIKNNYKQITLKFGIDFTNTISRAFSEGNYNITYQEDDNKYSDQKLQDYLQTEINTYGSLENFMKFVFVSLKTIDANGIIAIKPDLPYQENGDGTYSISKTKLNEPQIYYYDCSKVVAYKEEEYCLVETTKYSFKKGKPVKVDEYTYEFYDKENIFGIVYNVKDKTATTTLIYNHDEGILPTTKIKGVPRIIDGDILWQSVFSFVTDILDIIALDASTLQISKFKCAYPTRVYEGRPCDFQFTDTETNDLRQCQDGTIYIGSELKKSTCTKCNGTGQIDRFNAMRDFVTAPSTSTDPVKVNPDPFRYVSPDPTILKYLEDSIAKNEEKAQKILHLQTSNSIVKGTENLTATGQSIDQKAMYAFIKPISDQMFDTMQFIIDRIGYQRYGSAYKAPTINKPVTFDFQTEYDYIEEISAATTAGLPPFMLQTIIVRYLKSHFYSDYIQTKAFDLIINTDRLLGLSNNDISIQQSKGLISDWEIVFHTSAISIIRNELLKDEKFFEKDIKDQQIAVTEASKKIAEEAKPDDETQKAINAMLKPVA